jgi:hypothetical protein
MRCEKNSTARRESDDRATSPEDDRDRPVVHELDAHACAERTGGNLHSLSSESRAEAVDQGASTLGARSVRETGAVSSRRVGKKGELTHDEGLSTDVDDRVVEPAAFVLEDSKPRHLDGEGLGVVRFILFGDAEEDQQSWPARSEGLLVDRDRSTPHALDDGSHLFSLSDLRLT